MRNSTKYPTIKQCGSRWIAPGVLHPWDRERKVVLRRTSPTGRKNILDRDVNYFVLQLERIGCKTLYSCGGHPDNFYILFEASYWQAVKIEQCGYFNVSLTPRIGEFHLWHDFRKDERGSSTPKDKLLRWTAVAWEQKLGPLRKKFR